ncbi:porin family protein [Aminobacter anthyllidis]|uniref:Porin family protein n=1 Tax=Aminobacter anthyllidis TaxID=1035067 RepID=A0A9X1A8C7_9HYPH|nr:outer membrane protein [Aminobacter anthyllidis]MBT1155129.1 porin family protein [Aminobacter anthyllidis]MDH4985599.1 porin family protein [Aminobacter anthyllidis]
MTAILKHARPLAAAFGLIALASMPAFAADVVMEEPPAPAAPMEQPPLNTWSGPYAGVTLGYGFSGEADAAGNKIGTSGFLGGAFAGYNYQMENFVIGAEGDLGYSGVEGDNAGTSVKNGFEGSLRARLGYVVTPDILLYATAGGAGAQVKATQGGIEDKNTMLGWTAGVGTDVKLTESVFGRVEYRYTDLGSDTFSLGAGNTEISNKDHRIQFGVGMKF